MSLEIPVTVHNRRDHTKANLIVKITERDTVKTVGDQVSSKIGISRSNLSTLLCGKALDDSVPIKELLLGPATSLIVLVTVEQKDVPKSSTSSEKDSPQIGSFYLFCKSCKDVTRGKLRVYCDSCSGSAVEVKNDPTGWEDVLLSKRIIIDCADCQRAETYARFRFKCVQCNEIAAPLSHVRGNWEQSLCIVCADENQKWLIDLSCNHPICRDCFSHYVETSLEQGSFSFRPPYGYTLSCAYTNCDLCIRDAHHFQAVLGEEKYKKYQEQATEKLVAFDELGVVCPFPDCNNHFFWELENKDGSTYCPNCFRHFCRNCKSRECICNSREDLTKVTIAATTRNCPRCNASTEKNGGCSHMKCIACGNNWCFHCGKIWSDECQFDHWFS